MRAGDFWFVESDEPAVYSFIRHSSEETLLVVVNLSKEAVSGYRLMLKEGPLAGAVGAVLLLGEGVPVTPALNAAGGFDAYTPLPVLPARSSVIIQIRP